MGNNKIQRGKCGRTIVHNNHLTYNDFTGKVVVCYGVNPGSDRANLFSKVGGGESNLWPSFAWPGGYDIAYVMDDGEYLCGHCMNAESNVHFKDEDPTEDGWLVIGFDTANNWETGEMCGHCNRHLGPEED